VRCGRTPCRSTTSAHDNSGAHALSDEHERPPDARFYNPRVCIIQRGSKTVSLGEAPFDADPSTFLLVTMDLPVASRVVVADDGRPHIDLTLDLDRALLAEVLQRLPMRPIPATPPAGLVASTMQPALLEPVARLLNLLDRADEVDFVRPLILREIHYRFSGAGSATRSYSSL
jgi:hypothetical protein